ncbi:MAG: hypothetical protein AAFU85_30355 [Planctomycetota bacterium]
MNQSAAATVLAATVLAATVLAATVQTAGAFRRSSERDQRIERCFAVRRRMQYDACQSVGIPFGECCCWLSSSCLRGMFE